MGKFKKIDKALANGGIGLLPTETVYGLAVDPRQTDAVDRLYAIKGRDFNKPLALCVKNIKQAERYGEVAGLAKTLAKKFWPGPLTLIVAARKDIDLDPRLLSSNTAGETTIALRCPDVSWTKRLKTLPLALTSANASGEPDPLTFREAYYIMGPHVQAFIDGPTASLGLPSTLLAVSRQSVKILRSGSITVDDLAEFNIDWTS